MAHRAFDGSGGFTSVTSAIILAICFYVTIIIGFYVTIMVGCFAGFMILLPIILDAETQTERILAIILASVIGAIITLMVR